MWPRGRWFPCDKTRYHHAPPKEYQHRGVARKQNEGTTRQSDDSSPFAWFACFAVKKSSLILPTPPSTPAMFLSHWFEILGEMFIARFFIPAHYLTLEHLSAANSGSVEVGTRVAPCPPHRSRQAVFPHRALQLSTSSSPTGRFASSRPSFLRRWLPV